LLLLLVIAALSAAVSGCASSPPAVSSASAGTVEHRPVPTSILDLPLTDQLGRQTDLASYQGKVVMLVPFLTLCHEICPLTTGNLLQIQVALKAAHLEDRVQLVELSIDPGRDDVARLSAYATLTGASWELVTESPATLEAISNFFGFVHYRAAVDVDAPPDWLTGKTLTYDVDHSNGYVLINGTGTQIFTTGAAPDLRGTLNPVLRRYLSDLGVHNLLDPAPTAWSTKTALSELSWASGTFINPAAH
jgi:protein SCO1